MTTSIYKTLIAAGVPDDKAREITESISTDVVASKTDVNEIKRKLEDQSDMLGFCLVFIVLILFTIAT